MKISIVGSGYVGLITAAGLASKDYNVVCIDIDEGRVNMINRAEPPFYEDQLAESLQVYVKQKENLKATSNYESLLNSDATFICVNTSRNNGENADFSQIKESTKEIGKVLRRKEEYHVVITKSSVVPETTEGTIIPLLEQYSGKKAGKDFGVGVNPEFLQEGRALQCFLNSDRIIIGEYDDRSGDFVQNIYKEFDTPIIRTGLRTAEMIKFASNAFLATKISFINEIGNLCKTLGVDVYQVAEGVGYDPRISRSFLNAGIGFGGSCLPKDLELLLSKYEKMGETAAILNAVSRVNKAQPLKMVEITQRRLGELINKKLAILGLAFKPNTDDIRHAPAVEIVHQLLHHGAQVKVYDPKAMPKAQEVFSQRIQYGNSIQDTIEGCDCILILTEWNEFKDESIYAGKMVIDGRRTLDPEKAKRVCRYYEGICW